MYGTDNLLNDKNKKRVLIRTGNKVEVEFLLTFTPLYEGSSSTAYGFCTS